MLEDEEIEHLLGESLFLLGEPIDGLEPAQELAVLDIELGRLSLDLSTC